MKTILVATDFSERSDRAIRRAILLARQFDAMLELVHVVDDDQPRRLVNAGQSAASDLLTLMTDTLRDSDGVDCRSSVVLGDPFEGIAGAARDLQADIVVVGSHRRHLLNDIFVGTTAERAIRSCGCPVLMANGVPAGPYRHGLAALDFSDCSAGVVSTIRVLGFDSRMAISVVHVFDAPAASLMGRASSTARGRREYLLDEEEQAVRDLSAFLEKCGFEPIDRLVKRGDASPAHEIVAAASGIDADLLVIGTRGRTWGARTLLGSVAEEVLRVAACDVLAMPPAPAR